MGQIKKLKKSLIDSLTEPERLSLITLLSTFSRSLKLANSSSMYLKNLETPTFFGLLHRLLFGNFGYIGEATVAKIMENLDGLKEILQGVPITISFPKNPDESCVTYPQMPKGLQISNKAIKEVLVTTHAWQRFYERFYPKKSDSNKVADAIRTSFSRAQPVKLERGYEVIRLINNSFEQTQYLFDRTENCRFVVIWQDGKLVLKTVEIPY